MLSVPQNLTADALLITHFDDVEAFFFFRHGFRKIRARRKPSRAGLELFSSGLSGLERSRAISSGLERSRAVSSGLERAQAGSSRLRRTQSTVASPSRLLELTQPQ